MFFIIFASHTKAKAQNLVPNGSFEEVTECPKDLNELYKLEQWYNPTKTTPDVFSSCNGKNWNKLGKQSAHNGENYAGLIVEENRKYQEYLAVRLSEKLERGETYRVSCYVSLADRKHLGVDHLEAHLTRRTYKWPFEHSLFSFGKKRVELTSASHAMLMDKDNWVLIQGFYKARGRESILLLGAFTPIRMKFEYLEKGYETHRVDDNKSFTYYYVDDVKVELASDPIIETQTLEDDTMTVSNEERVDTMKNYPVNESIVLRDVHFETAKSNILPKSFAELNKVVDAMVERPELLLEVAGHTDNEGSDEFNQELSDDRAAAVAKYITDSGVEQSRITSKGFGSSEPTMTNDTEYGRSQNRRVEVRFVIK